MYEHRTPRELRSYVIYVIKHISITVEKNIQAIAQGYRLGGQVVNQLLRVETMVLGSLMLLPNSLTPVRAKTLW